MKIRLSFCLFYNIYSFIVINNLAVLNLYLIFRKNGCFEFYHFQNKLTIKKCFFGGVLEKSAFQTGFKALVYWRDFSNELTIFGTFAAAILFIDSHTLFMLLIAPIRFFSSGRLLAKHLFKTVCVPNVHTLLSKFFPHAIELIISLK